ncbi:MAG: hypothetical protein QOE96_2445 [Blastocatellia bacterium]|jgi:hypothetical protein|nr:hypothetical protein [Blastocatellia bacterium]
MQLLMHQAGFSNLMLTPEAIDSIFDDDNYVEVDALWLQAAKEKTEPQTSEPNQSHDDDRTQHEPRTIHNQSA